MGETTRDLYVHRMRNCRPFQFFGIHPEWFPGEKDVEGFIHDEVVRQFHDTRVREDGGVRIQWMEAAWEYAQRNSNVTPTVQDIIKLGALVEPKKNGPGGPRIVDIQIAGHRGCPPVVIPELLSLLVVQIPELERVQGLGPLGRHDWRAAWKWYDSKSLILEEFSNRVPQVKTVDDWYLCYEMIHPFADGNGRTGKILHNWLLGTLDDPVLVEDYFGEGNP